jgi:hypothetical protein
MQSSKQIMHRSVLGWLVIFAAFAASFPIAMMRVSQTAQFAGQPVKSLTCKGQHSSQRTITQFQTCVQLNALTQ